MSAFRLLYASHVRPRLEYFGAAAYPCTAGDLAKLERVQHAATRLVVGLRGISYEGLPQSTAYLAYDILETMDDESESVGDSSSDTSEFSDGSGIEFLKSIQGDQTRISMKKIKERKVLHVSHERQVGTEIRLGLTQ
ncbi:unnamed protein product [Echinostoma caproni]|uniref:SAC domain-containing protein n=1 Tax=Echinostoma caproni TaxID=27848 RepID=A0A183AH18_9TREM|nr:unnamed protein product [Echinostoma caproni]